MLLLLYTTVNTVLYTSDLQRINGFQREGMGRKDRTKSRGGKKRKKYDKIEFGQNCLNNRFYQKNSAPFFEEISHGTFIALI